MLVGTNIVKCNTINEGVSKCLRKDFVFDIKIAKAHVSNMVCIFCLPKLLSFHVQCKFCSHFYVL